MKLELVDAQPRKYGYVSFTFRDADVPKGEPNHALEVTWATWGIRLRQGPFLRWNGCSYYVSMQDDTTWENLDFKTPVECARWISLLISDPDAAITQVVL